MGKNLNYYQKRICYIKIPKEGSQFICWSVILTDSVFRTGKDYYQLFLEEWKYVVKEKKLSKYITDEIEISSGSDREMTF